MPARTPLARRLTALALLALPLGAAAGCGATPSAVRSNVEAELQQASTHLQDSRSTSMTLRFEDPQGTAKKALTSGDDPARPALADALLGGTVSITVDPTGERTLRDVRGAGPDVPVAEQLELANLAFSISADGGALAQVRIVGGDLYVSADVSRIFALAEKAGDVDASQQLEALVGQAPPQLMPVLRDLQAGRWLKLPLAKYATQLDRLARTQPPPSADPEELGNDLLAAVRPFVTVTDAGGEDGARVLDVQVQARKALEAVLDTIRSVSPTVPGLDELDSAALPEITDGTVDGQVLLQDGHLTRVTLDLASVGRLAPEGERSPELAGTRLALDVDDTADEVVVPDDVSGVDVGEVVQGLIGLGLAGTPS